MTRPLSLFALLLAIPPAVADPPTADQWKQVVAKATAFAAAKQNPDGSWGDVQRAGGVTGVVVTGLLKTGTAADAAPAANGLKFIESLVDPVTGHIAGVGAKVNLHNYVTSVNVMALVEAKRDAKYKPVVGDAVAFLKKLQWDDGEGKTASDDFFGGAGYDSKSRPDLSNTQFFLDALKSAGVGPNDEAMKKATVFVSRCQNLKSEHNDRAWAGKIDDGSFLYSAAAGGQTKTSDDPTAPLTGYGSMTYAGIKSMIYCGVGKDDPRMKKGVQWIANNYTVDSNPGMPPQLAARGYYYYLHTMAKAMDALGVDEFTDAKGVKHDWRADIFAALAKRQKPDGSWVNETDRWMEGDPMLVTGYALMTLGYCKPN